LYLRSKVIKAVKLNDKVAEFVLKTYKPLAAEPGQYVMVWVPRVGEIPIAISSLNENVLKLVIARKGKVTSHLLNNLGKVRYLQIRGPYGKGFDYKGVSRALIIGGGYGLAPLRFLCEKLVSLKSEVHSYLGFKTANDIILSEYFSKVSKRMVISTEDGSTGIRGTVLEAMKKTLSNNYDKAYLCGPELMEKEVLQFLLGRGIPVEVSLERLIKCGIGVCGSCVLEPEGFLVCRDGPVFEGKKLAKVEDFGKYWHDWSGRRVPI